MENKTLTLTREQIKSIYHKENSDFIIAITDAFLTGIGGSLTADNMSQLSTDQHSLLAYRYLLDEVMEGGFIQLIHNGYGPYIFEGPFPYVIKKVWGFKDFGKFLFNVQHEYHMHKDEIFTELSEEEFMALYEQLEELNEYGDDFLDDFQETITPAITEYVKNNIDKFA